MKGLDSDDGVAIGVFNTTCPGTYGIVVFNDGGLLSCLLVSGLFETVRGGGGGKDSRSTESWDRSKPAPLGETRL